MRPSVKKAVEMIQPPSTNTSYIRFIRYIFSKLGTIVD